LDLVSFKSLLIRLLLDANISGFSLLPTDNEVVIYKNNVIIGISSAFAVSVLIIAIILMKFILHKYKTRANIQNEDANISNTAPVAPPRPEHTLYLQIQSNQGSVELQTVELNQPLVYDYVTAPVQLYHDAHGESHLNEGRASDVAQNIDEPVHYDYVTAPVELYQDAHGENYLNEGRTNDGARASDVTSITEEPVHYDYVTAPM
jgi:hypothetical protein